LPPSAGPTTPRRSRACQVRARTERYDGDWDAPTSHTVQQQVNPAFAAAFHPKPRAATPDTETLPEVTGVNDLDDNAVAEARAEARQRLMLGDTSLITVPVDAMGRETAKQLYGTNLVRRALQLASAARSSLLTYGRR
jgi:hypothetical protein